MRFSYSSLNQFQNCPLQWKFARLDLLPQQTGSKQIFGNVIHEALAQYNRGAPVEECIEAFKQWWDEPEQLGLHIDQWTRYTNFGGLRERGIQIIREYDERLRFEKRTVLAVEHRFQVPLGHHTLEGVVDVLELRKNHRGKDLLLVTDLKTASKTPYVQQLHVNVQFTLYLYATTRKEFWLGNGDDFYPIPNGEWYMETLRDVDRRGIWHSLWGNKVVDAGGRTDDDYGRLLRMCDEVENAVNKEVFVPRIGEDCTMCSYASGPCPVEVWAENDIKEQESAWL